MAVRLCLLLLTDIATLRGIHTTEWSFANPWLVLQTCYCLDIRLHSWQVPWISCSSPAVTCCDSLRVSVSVKCWHILFFINQQGRLMNVLLYSPWLCIYCIETTGWCTVMIRGWRWRQLDNWEHRHAHTHTKTNTRTHGHILYTQAALVVCQHPSQAAA